MNNIEYGAIFQKELDEQMVPALATGWMDGNADMTKYSGGREIKIPKITMDGMGNYDRQNGYVEGSVTLEWQTMEMTMDRGRSFTLDAMDVDETNFAMSAGNVMGEFQRAKVVPEIDAYRLSTAAKLAGTRARTLTPTAANILKELKADVAAVQDEVGEDEELVIHMSTLIAQFLDVNADVARQLSVGEFKKGEMTLKVKMLDNIPILRTPSSRMKTGFVFYDGQTESDGAAQDPTPDQRPGGFAPAADAVGINWLIIARRAPIGVTKTDKVRVFDPSTYQKANAWHIDYRKYHDLWIPDNKKNGLFANKASS